MRLTIDVDTDQLTDRDRRVFAALIGDENSPLVLPREMYRDANTGSLYTPPSPEPVAPPLPVPVPADFAARLGKAVQQFAPQGSGPEARLPFAQQAGVRTSSTMPDDDDEAEVLLHRGEDAAPEQPEEVWVEPVDDGPQVIRARGGVKVPRSLVEEPPPDDPGALVREAVLRQPLTAPVRHTSP